MKEMLKNQELIRIEFDKMLTILHELGIEDLEISGVVEYYLAEIQLRDAGLDSAYDFYEHVVSRLEEINESVNSEK